MSGHGDWTERPPGTEDEMSSSYHGKATSYDRNVSIENKQYTSSERTASHNKDLSSQAVSYSSSRANEASQRSRSRENYPINRRSSRSPSKSPRYKSRRSRSSSSSRGKSSRRNRRYASTSSSTSKSSRSSRSSSRGKSLKYKKRSRSRSKTKKYPRETDRYRKKAYERNGSSTSRSSSCSTDGSSGNKRYKKKYRSPDRKCGYSSRSFRSYKSHERDDTNANVRNNKPAYKTSKTKFNNCYSATTTTKPHPAPAFKNDGSFLEMFKKMQEAHQSTDSQQSASTSNLPQDIPQTEQIKKPVAPFVGKRRGGRVLKTGMVKKAKTIEEQTVDNNPSDAWSLYLKEVKKYRETSCEEEGKTRPLVK